MNVHSFATQQVHFFTMNSTRNTPLASETPSEKREKILKATLCLLSSRGFHGFSIKQLADRASVAAGTIYLYFKDKEDLIQQLHWAIIHDIAQATFQDLDPSLAPRDQYRLMCRNFWHFCKNNAEVVLSKGQFDHLPPDILRSQYVGARSQFRPLFELFEQCRKDGSLRPMPDEALVALTIDAFCSLAHKHYLQLIDVDDALVEQVISATWQGISAPD